MPSVHRKSTADNSLRTRHILGPNYCVSIAAAIGCAKQKRTIDAVDAASEPDDNVVIAVYLAHRALCALERSERMIHRPIGSIISRRRNANDDWLRAT